MDEVKKILHKWFTEGSHKMLSKINADLIDVYLCATPIENRSPFPLEKRKRGRPTKEQLAYIELHKAWLKHNKIKYPNYYRTRNPFSANLLLSRFKNIITKDKNGVVKIKYRQRK